MSVPAERDLLTELAAWTALSVGAEHAVVRLAGHDGRLTAIRVWARSPSLAAELAGSHVEQEEIDREGPLETDPALHVARRAVLRGETPVGSLELVRPDSPFEHSEIALLELAARQLAVVLHARDDLGRETMASLELAGEGLVAGSPGEAGDRIARLAAAATGARAAILWLLEEGRLDVAYAHGIDGDPPAAFVEAARSSLDGPGPVSIDRGENVVATLALGEPPLGSLQLVFSRDAAPLPNDLSRLAGFGVRAARALRAAQEAARATEELERTQALVTVVGQAVAQLSLSHTLETAVDQLAELLGIDHLAVYLVDGSRLEAVAERGLEGPHPRVAEQLLDLALGPYRGRDSLRVEDVGRFGPLRRVRAAAEEAGIASALAVPLVAHGQVTGLLAVYPPAGHAVGEREAALVSALAPQLAVAVENARLHEEATRLGEERKQALAAEQRALRQTRALYEISRSFAQSLSLDETLAAVARTLVTELHVDAAAVRMLDERGERLVTRSVHVADEQLAESAATLLSRPQPADIAPVRRVLGAGEPLVLDAEAAANLPGHEALAPFLEKGSTAVILPVATPVEVVATATLISFNPVRPIGEDTVELALSIAAQAALAIDNGRLYQQQKGLADTMQQALLAGSEPDLEGFEIGAVYESSGRVDVGGDVYDFATLDDGRLAVVLGDVAGHGIEAAADMAMAKYVFRSLCREHPDPGEFLAAANDVMLGELAPGKFITMVYLTVDPSVGRIVCASAGHPAPRVLVNGEVTELAARGLPLGVEEGEAFEEASLDLPHGAVVVLHTDGVVESRSGRQQFGIERLDGMLRADGTLGAKALAEAIVAASREFAGGELPDDCAVVVIRRTGSGV